MSCRVVSCALLALACGGETGPTPAPTVTMPSREEHQAYFEIQDVFHRAVACSDCHADYDTFREFTCSTAQCHPQVGMDAVHATVAGYQFRAAACLACHPDSEIPPP